MHPTDADTVGHHTPGGNVARAASRLRRIVALAAITSLIPLSGTAVASTAQVSVDAAAAPGGRASAADEAIARNLDQRITDTRLGPRVSGFVMDAESDNVVWQHQGTQALMPASNAKLFTAVAALAVLGPGHRFQTRVVHGPDALTLVGGGDRTLTTADLAELARTTAARLRAAGVLRTQVRVDDSLFGEPALANGWDDSYYPDSVAPVRALVVDGRPLMDTALDAGQEFARQLTAAGIDVVGDITRDEADSEAPVVARHDSGELAEIVTHMLRTSDNNIAESLLRATALGTGRPATFAGGIAALRATLSTRYGLDLSGVELNDGSGLSRADRVPASVIADILDLVQDHHQDPRLAPVLVGLPVSGEAGGTLGPEWGRFDDPHSQCAVGLVKAKTGTLTGALALSGVTRGGDGRWKVFSFVENDSTAPPAAVRDALDGLAATVNGCWGS